MARICTRCGLTQAGTLRHCQRCSLALHAAGTAAPSPRPVPLVPAAQQPGRAPPVQAARETAAPRSVVAAAATGPARPLSAGGPAASMLRPPAGPRAVRALAWVSASVLGASGLLVLARTAVPPDAAVDMAAWLQATPAADAGEPATADTVALEPEQVRAEPGQPDAAVAATNDHAERQTALQDILDGAGLGSVRVQLQDDGVATLQGELPAGVERQLVQQWLAGQDGVLRVIDRTRAAPVAAAPANRRAAPAAAPDSDDADDEDVQPAMPQSPWVAGDRPGRISRSETQTQRRSDGVQESTTTTTVRITRELR